MDEKRKVFIDCDPGIDDSFALLLAMKHLDVVAVTAVGGNTGLENTSRNARYVVQLAGRSEIPVCAGYDRPMFTKLERAENVHGTGGLGAVVIPEPKKQLEKGHAVDIMIDTFFHDSEVTLVTLGPLTNVAHALLKEPELKNRIPRIVCMGGSVTAGNYSACAEFNIAVDPEAAKIVFESGIPIEMVGLNLCRQNAMTIEDVKRIRALPGGVAEFAADLLEFSVNGDRQAQLCDACAMAWLIEPEIVLRALPMHVAIETRGEFTRGMTVCDYREYICPDPREEIGKKTYYPVAGMSAGAKNVLAAMEFDQKRFKELLFRTLESYGA